MPRIARLPKADATNFATNQHGELMKRRVSNTGPSSDSGAGDTDLCVLVQPVAGVAATDVLSSRPAAEGEGNDAEAPCITHVDRTMIRAYFRRTDSAPSPRLNDSRDDRRASAHPELGMLPPDLEDKLSALPPGYMRMIPGKDVILVEAAS